jgi:hypothetical protein
MLNGRLNVRFGEPLRLSGVAYAVSGLDDLRPSAGEIRAELRHYDRESRSWSTVSQATATADRDGRFGIDVPTPSHSASSLQLRLLVGGQVGRWFEYSVSLAQAHQLDLRTDRQLYQAGETVHLFAIARRLSTGAPEAGARVGVRINDPEGRALIERTLTADASGSVSLDLPLPDSAASGTYQVVADATLAQGDELSWRSNFVVGRRTVERILAELVIDQRVVRPRQRVSGHVSVHTPSGAPVVGASVRIRQPHGEEVTVQSDAEGHAAFEMAAPSYLTGDVQHMSVQAHITHPGHGALHIGGGYVLARTRYQVEVHAASGAVVPGVPTFAYLRVSDPLSEPAEAGTGVEVSGPAVRGGSHRGTVDEHGLLEVPLLLDLADVAPIQTEGYNGPAGPATLLEVEIMGRSASGAARPVQTRTCVSVSKDASVVPRVAQSVVDQGGQLQVEVARRESVRNDAVLVEVIEGHHGQVIATAWAAGGADRVQIQLPPHAIGAMWVRARPVSEPNARAPLNEVLK